VVRTLVFSLVPPSTLPPNPMILDAGCGTGYSMVWFRNRYGARVTGVDYHRFGLSFARRRGEASLVCADVASLPLATDSFDLVSCFDVVSVMDDSDSRARAMKESGVKRKAKTQQSPICMLFLPVYALIFSPDFLTRGALRV